MYLKSIRPACVFTAALALLSQATIAETFRVATYNVENYLDQTTESRKNVKSDEAKAKVRECIRAMKPDVIAFQEMGSLSALMELRDSLKKDGLDFSNWEHITGHDTNIHVAVLSRFPIVARRQHTNDSYLLNGRRFKVSRGFAEVDIKVNNDYTFTLITAHLKSRRPVPDGDEAEMRLEEAKLLREKVDARLASDPNANLIVLGDFNHTYNTPSTKAVIGRGKTVLVDTRPAERNGDNQPNPTNPRYSPRNVTWTHYYGLEDTYARIDYLLISQAMARHWKTNDTFIPTIPNWGIGSDHRPLVAGFETNTQ